MHVQAHVRAPSLRDRQVVPHELLRLGLVLVVVALVVDRAVVPRGPALARVAQGMGLPQLWLELVGDQGVLQQP